MGWSPANVSVVWEADPRMQMETYTPSQLRWNTGCRNATGHLQCAKTLSLFLLVIPVVSHCPQRKRSLASGKVATHP
jgi:hypothetical protein